MNWVQRRTLSMKGGLWVDQAQGIVEAGGPRRVALAAECCDALERPAEGSTSDNNGSLWWGRMKTGARFCLLADEGARAEEGWDGRKARGSGCGGRWPADAVREMKAVESLSRSSEADASVECRAGRGGAGPHNANSRPKAERLRCGCGGCGGGAGDSDPDRVAGGSRQDNEMGGDGKGGQMSWARLQRRSATPRGGAEAARSYWRRG